MKFALVLPLLFALASCVTYRIDPVAKEGVQILKDRNHVRAVLQSGTADLEVVATWESDLEFAVTVKNKSDKVLHLDSDDFQLFSGDNDRWHQVDLITSKEYYDREAKRLFARNTLLAVAVLSDDPPPVTTRRTTIIGGGNSSVTIVETRRTYYDDPYERERDAAVIANASRSGQARLDWLKDHLFYQVDLEPGKSFDGLVYGPTLRDEDYKLVIPVDGKKQTFYFHLTRKRWSPLD